jgi:hypothetical protein
MNNGKVKKRVRKLWYTNNIRESSSRGVSELEAILQQNKNSYKWVLNKVEILFMSGSDKDINLIKSKFGGYPYFWTKIFFARHMLRHARTLPNSGLDEHGEREYKRQQITDSNRLTGRRDNEIEILDELDTPDGYVRCLNGSLIKNETIHTTKTKEVEGENNRRYYKCSSS